MHNFFYLLKGTLYRSSENPNDFVEINEIYQDDNPIEAREHTFTVCQNYIDVLLQSIGEEYESHEKTRVALKSFLNQKVHPTQKSDAMKSLTIEKSQGSINEYDFDKGISIFMVMSDSKTFTTLEGELIYKNKLLIHDLNSELTGIQDHIRESLIKEFEIYKKYGYDYKEYAVKALGTGNEMILRTPMFL